MTAFDSGKTAELFDEPEVAVAMQGNARVVSISGKAEVVIDRTDKVEELWSETWRPWFPGGPAVGRPSPGVLGGPRSLVRGTKGETMPKTISRDALREKLQGGGPVLIEVLGAPLYRKFHLPGAINIPLGDDFRSRVQETVPDKSQEVVVYCADAECDASPKAARQMEEMGYRHVLDYAAGKQDWKDAGLPVHGAS